MAKPKLCLIPAAQGDKFYSVLPSSGVGDFDFTRSGGATRINSQGLIETVADGVSRLNYPLIDGKVVGCPSHLLENSATNLVAYSEDFSQSSWLKVNNAIVSDTKVISPNGTLNASQIIFDGTSQGRIEDPIGGLTQGADYTVSVYARVSNGTQVVEFGSVNDFEYTLTTEWQRLTSTEAENDTVAYPRLICNDAVTIEIYGFQFEQNSVASSYIPTNGSIATRSAETANNSGDASTFNDSEGVLMAEISALSDDGTSRVISINDGGSSDYIHLRYHSVSNTVRFIVRSGNITSFDYFITLPSTEEYNKIAIKYDNTNVYLWANGFEYFQFSPITTPIGLSTLDFDDSLGNNDFYGNTKQIQYYNSALTDSELETLTSWVSFSDMAEGQLYTIE